MVLALCCSDHQLPPAVSASPNVHGPQRPVAGTIGDASQFSHFPVQSGAVSGSCVRFGTTALIAALRCGACHSPSCTAAKCWWAELTPLNPLPHFGHFVIPLTSRPHYLHDEACSLGGRGRAKLDAPTYSCRR